MNNNHKICPNCGSDNLNIQIINETKLVKKSKGFLYWLLIGWWFELLMWFFLTMPRLLIAIFIPKKKKIVNVQKKICVCQSCGSHWNIN